MTADSHALAATALVVGAVHTILGPDHYLPFIALGRARGWTLRRTLGLALVCGAAHVASSALLGLGGFAGGRAIADLVAIDGARGSLAGWLLFAIGLAYGLWGVRAAVRGRPHAHFHIHADGTAHRHLHHHHGSHAHLHAARGSRATPVAWGLFLVFVFGPCEPLIPLFIYPAASGGSALALVAVTGAFALATLGTMAVLLVLGFRAVEQAGRRAGSGLDRWSHAVAGATLALCGLLVNVGW